MMISPSQLFFSRPDGVLFDRPATNHRLIIPRNAAFLERRGAVKCALIERGLAMRMNGFDDGLEGYENTMATDDLEKRVAALEAEVAKLKAALGSAAERPRQWWNEIAGSFAGDPLYEEAMRLGREWRESFRPKRSPKKKSDGRSRRGEN